jgi:predicted transcriptional regulator
MGRRTRDPDATPTIDEPPPREIKGTESRRLRCELTGHELMLKGEALAKALSERNELEAHHKSLRAAEKELEAAAGSVVRTLLYDVRDRSEERSVECEIVHDYALGARVVIRTDTGETVASRPLLDSERQRELV